MVKSAIPEEIINGNGMAKAKKEVTTELMPLRISEHSIRIVGLSPLITHAWSTKAKEIMLDRQMKKTIKKVDRDPENECEEGLYKLSKGGYGMPVDSFKQCIVGVGDKDVDKNLAKTKLRMAFFIKADDISVNGNVPCIRINGDWRMREDMVRIGMGSADLRFRPEFPEWTAILRFELDYDRLSLNQLLNLVKRGGWSIGIGEWRPEKDGQFGRFEIQAA